MEKHFEDVNMEDDSTMVSQEKSMNNQNSSMNEEHDQCMEELEDNGVLSPQTYHEQPPV